MEQNAYPEIIGTPDLQKETLLVIEGTVERVIYANEENGYCICEIAVSEAEYVTLVGTMPYVSVAERLRAYGNWVTHPTFGRQFKVQYYEKKLPDTKQAILKYLSSRTVKGIGPKTAEALVKEFGEDTFDVIENHPEWMSHLPGISPKKAESISQSFREQHGLRSVMMFCRDLFGPTTAVRVYRRWGIGAIERIQENPYLLCKEAYGIGFSKADRMAHQFGIAPDAAIRIEAALENVCRYNAFQNGHSFLPEDKLLHAVEEMLQVPAERCEDALLHLTQQGELVSVKLQDRHCIYLREYYDAERYVCEKMDLLDRVCPTIDDTSAEHMIDKTEQREHISYAKLQRHAIRAALKSGIMILTGGPGTGKTTVIRAIMDIFDDMGMRIALVAPTGRAAKRMSEATQYEAKTIHRLLEMEYNAEGEAVFKRDRDHLLAEQVIIVDEASMVDLLLMNALLLAIKPGAHLLLIGDSDQLPPVGAGNVLHDLIQSERFSTVRLTHIFRQAQQSMIVTNAHAVNAGEMPRLDVKDSDFFFLERNDDRQVANTIESLCAVRLPKTYGEQIADQIQVIAPSRKGHAGTLMLNELLQSVLNPPHEEKKEQRYGEKCYRVGDKVMQIRNNYDLQWKRETLAGETEGAGVFNGDIGVITDIDRRAETFSIVFDDRVVQYPFELLGELEHAFAITVHKSQGSEYPIVVIPVCHYTPKLMTRNLLYTAITRASRMVILVGQKETVQHMVANNRQTKRYSGLPIWLGQYDAQNGAWKNKI